MNVKDKITSLEKLIEDYIEDYKAYQTTIKNLKEEVRFKSEIVINGLMGHVLGEDSHIEADPHRDLQWLLIKRTKNGHEIKWKFNIHDWKNMQIEVDYNNTIWNNKAQYSDVIMKHFIEIGKLCEWLGNNENKIQLKNELNEYLDEFMKDIKSRENEIKKKSMEYEENKLCLKDLYHEAWLQQLVINKPITIPLEVVKTQQSSYYSDKLTITKISKSGKTYTLKLASGSYNEIEVGHTHLKDSTFNENYNKSSFQNYLKLKL